MDFVAKVKNFITDIPIIGMIVTVLIAIYAINELINKITLGKINIMGKLVDAVPIFSKKHQAMIQKNYYRTLNSSDFIQWEYSLLKKVYGGEDFIQVLGREYPVLCFESASICEYPFTNLYSDKDLDTNINGQFRINSKIQKEYYRIVKEKIKRPGLPGFMLKQLVLDVAGKIVGFYAYTGTYEQNVYTSHILEYELYKAYKKMKANVNVLSNNDILEWLPLRKSIHRKRTIKEIISTGIGRYSLIGVQMLVLYKNHLDNKYNVLFIKRSQDVAAKPGFYQFIPSGGFEIFENDDAIVDLEVRPRVLRNNFSLQKALFREFVEEVFGKQEFVHNFNGVPVDSIMGNQYVLEILDMLSKKEAFFEFLGSTIDLVGLRHEFSFILRIDNINFSKHTFEPNHESANVDNCKLEEIEFSINRDKFNQGRCAKRVMRYA